MTSLTLMSRALQTALVSSSGSAGEGNGAVRPDRLVERGARRGERDGAVLGSSGSTDVAQQRHDRPAPCARGGGTTSWVRRSFESRGVGQQLEIVRDVLRLDRDRARPGGARTARGRTARVMISAPDAPSMAEWWTLTTKPTRSCLRPSMTHASHSGRLRSRGTEAICAATSPSSRRPPGAGARRGGRGSRGRSRGLRSTRGGGTGTGTSTSRRWNGGTTCSRGRDVVAHLLERVAALHRRHVVDPDHGHVHLP